MASEDPPNRTTGKMIFFPQLKTCAMAAEDPPNRATGKMIFFPQLSGFYNRPVSGTAPPSVNLTLPISRIDILANPVSVDPPAVSPTVCSPAEDDPLLKNPVGRPLNPLTYLNQPPLVYLRILGSLPKHDLHKIVMGNIYEMNPEEMHENYGENEQNEWYLLTIRGREYENETVIDRVIIMDEYWLLKASCPIMTAQQHCDGLEIGVCRVFKFYAGGQETAWTMHEFRLKDPCDRKFKVGDWVLCKIHKTQN